MKYETSRSLELKTENGREAGPAPVILIVDDEVDTLVMLSLELQRSGYRVANRSSPTKSSIQYRVQSTPTNGLLSGDAPNLVYTPAPNFSGTDTFTVVASDGDMSAPVTVTIEVGAVDDAPVAFAANAFTGIGQGTAIVLRGGDEEGSPITFEVVSFPQRGTLTGTAPNLTYTPPPDFYCIDTFTFRSFDGTRYSAPATIKVFVAVGEEFVGQ